MKKILITVIFLVSVYFVVHHFLWGNWGFLFLLEGRLIPPDAPYREIEEYADLKYLTSSQQITANVLFLFSLVVSYTTIWILAKKASRFFHKNSDKV